ncbi:MAG TPA: hypothetical protein PLO89_08610, partial [Spirochaetota bacterium]|nr:hypothetical protein [Spirochaetota bacterium]
MKLNFKKISIDDKNIFNDFFLKSYINISEYTFVNLFSWRNSRTVEFALYDEGLIILADYLGDKYFLPPVGFNDFDRIIDKIVEYGLKIGVGNIKRLDEKHISAIK